MPLKDRIIGLRRVSAKELLPHPKNWRQHPQKQRQALRGVLSDIGYADALLARQLADGRLQLIDGHLRVQTTPDAVVPVLVLDLDEAEAEKLLAVLDPLAAMATSDRAALDGLLEAIHTDDEGLQSLLDELAQDPAPDWNDEPAEINVAQAWQILVDCRDEADQRALYERLQGEGYACRVLTL
jgi:hypothetical protein